MPDPHGNPARRIVVPTERQRATSLRNPNMSAALPSRHRRRVIGIPSPSQAASGPTRVKYWNSNRVSQIITRGAANLCLFWGMIGATRGWDNLRRESAFER
jgi:hypothetical protein